MEGVVAGVPACPEASLGHRVGVALRIALLGALLGPLPRPGSRAGLGGRKAGEYSGDPRGVAVYPQGMERAGTVLPASIRVRKTIQWGCVAFLSKSSLAVPRGCWRPGAVWFVGQKVSPAVWPAQTTFRGWPGACAPHAGPEECRARVWQPRVQVLTQPLLPVSPWASCRIFSFMGLP